MREYFGGPYDGTIPQVVNPEAFGLYRLRVPCLPYVNDAGLRVYPALGSYERYDWNPLQRRYEWRGTHSTGTVDA